MVEMLLSLAILTQDQVPLRASPSENAARHAVLSQGDNLEVRSSKGDYLQVYDHRRERAGYVRATQVGLYSLKPEDAPQLKSIVVFLKDQPGQESMGIGHAAAYLKASKTNDADIFEAVGKMADRLAWRASQLPGDSEKAKIVTEHIATTASYGVSIYSVERKDKVILCYEGDAWRNVLDMPSSPEQKALAALSLTRHDCVKPLISPGERLKTDRWRAETVERALKADPPEHLKVRLKIRAAGLWAGLAHQLARRPDSDPAAVLDAGQKAEAYLSSVDKNALVDGDIFSWNEAAIRVGASRWAAQTATPVSIPGRPGISLSAGEPGQTCIQVIAGQKNSFSRCTYGQVWPASLAVSPDNKMMILAVQPLESWREMWVFHLEDDGWQVEALPPSVDPDLGYLEFAGWVPGNKQFLVARETVTGKRSKTTFELWNRDTLKVEKSAEKPGSLTPFHRWQDPVWKSGTVAVR